MSPPPLSHLPLSNKVEEHWLKLLPPRGTIHHGCTQAIKNLKATSRSLLCLPMRSKAAYQTADKTWVKREYFIHSFLQEGRSEILRTGETCCNLDPEVWTQCLFCWSSTVGMFNEETWSEEYVTSEVCRDTRGDDIYSRRMSLPLFSLSYVVSSLKLFFLMVLPGYFGVVRTFWPLNIV